MLRSALTALSLVFLVQPAFGRDGMVVVPSMQSTQTTMDRLEVIAKARDLKIFARIDHAAGARSIGEALRPTELLIFGHPKGGTPLLQCDQRYGLELPMRVLAWEDAQGKRWLGYPAAYAIKPADPQCEAALKRLVGVLDAMVKEATSE